jgi:polyribonucleotide nucleotidyltransferase
MKQEAITFTTELENQNLKFETGKLAGLAGGAVTLRVGDTMVFATATMSTNIRPGIDFLPLTVDFEERMYAGGRIPGSFFRREGRPGEEAILTARLTDRPLRPLFPNDLRNDIQVIIYSYSTDGNTPMDILAVNAASSALTISDIPWNGPVGAVRIGYINGKFVVNPTFNQLENSELDLRLAGTRDALLMVECGAEEVSEDLIIEALEKGQSAIQPIIDAQIRMAKEVGKNKRGYISQSKDDRLISTDVENHLVNSLVDILNRPYEKSELYSSIDLLREETLAKLTSEGEEDTIEQVKAEYNEILKKVIRNRILETGKRPDGRSPEDIRPIWCEVDVSPRAHGSGLFTRGETQVLTLATLGTPREAQELDNLTPSDTKRYIHHYNFPPFSTGEVKPLRGTSRRDVGHGALAERALLPVIPPEQEFPYTLRLVSEVLSSNGSSSMASVCGSTLALMDTGVPIKSPVAGIAMGLIMEGERYRILTDILGMEDHLGDMDFKVAGTRNGITALQMDIKTSGISSELMSQALYRAKDARFFVLDKMSAIISSPNPELKSHVPRITVINIPVDKIGAVIGPGGKTIRNLQEETGTKIDIDEDGTVFISAVDGESAQSANEKIEALTESPVIGRIYTGKVVRVVDFGAFVEILPNSEGLVHISQLDSQRVEKVEDVVREGDEITVMVTNIDSQGKIRLSRQAVLEGWTAEEATKRDRIRGGGRKSGQDRRRSNRRGSSSKR